MEDLGLHLGVRHPDHHLLAALLPAPAPTLRLSLPVPSLLRRSKLQVKTRFSPGPAGRLRGLVRLSEMGSGSVLGELGEHIFPPSKLVAPTGGRSLSGLLATCALPKEGFPRPGWGKHLLQLPLPKKCPGQVEKESPVRPGGGGCVACRVVWGVFGGRHGGDPVEVGATPIQVRVAHLPQAGREKGAPLQTSRREGGKSSQGTRPLNCRRSLSGACFSTRGASREWSSLFRDLTPCKFCLF